MKVISLEGWTDVMYIIQDTHSFYNFIYFVVLIIVSLVLKNYKSYLFFLKIGTFFMINLCLVVIANQFSETRRRETAKMKQEREYSSESSFSSFIESEDDEEDTNLYRDIINLIHYYLRRLCYRIRKFKRVLKFTEFPVTFSSYI